MSIASFVFSAYKNSFKVIVQNLEDLSVTQIQEIENFVKIRKGIFDFTTYSFTIQKKIEFFEFEKIVQNSSLNAICRDKPLMVKERQRVSFGQYKGVFYNELPDSYLLWLKNNYMGKDRKILDKELRLRSL